MSGGIRALPNAENLLSSFLRSDADVLATPLGDRIYTELPARNATWPAVRLTRFGGDADLLLTFERPVIQVDVWGGPKSVAQDIAQTIRKSLAGRLPFRTGDGCLKAVVRFGSMRYLPDTDYDPAKPRYLFDVEVLTTP